MQTPLEELLRALSTILKDTDDCHCSPHLLRNLLLEAADEIAALRKKALYIETEATDGNGLHICYTCVHETETPMQKVCETCLLGEGGEPNAEVSNRLSTYLNNRAAYKAAHSAALEETE